MHYTLPSTFIYFYLYIVHDACLEKGNKEQSLKGDSAQQICRKQCRKSAFSLADVTIAGYFDSVVHFPQNIEIILKPGSIQLLLVY